MLYVYIAIATGVVVCVVLFVLKLIGRAKIDVLVLETLKECTESEISQFAEVFAGRNGNAVPKETLNASLERLRKKGFVKAITQSTKKKGSKCLVRITTAGESTLKASTTEK